jgi:hypothetical protein
MTLVMEPPVASGTTLYPAIPAAVPADQLRPRADDRLTRAVSIGADSTTQLLAGYMKTQLDRLLALPDGWDGARARSITDSAVLTAVQVLFGFADDAVLPPQLVPLPDGGIQLEWHVDGNDLELEVDASGASYLLATDNSGKQVREGDFATSASALTSWLRQELQRLTAMVLEVRGRPLP